MADISALHDPTGGETAKPFQPGDYTLRLVKSEMTESKNKPGNHYLACEFEIEGSPRRVWENYNLVNSNATAQEIGWRDWNSLCHACGKLGVKDSSQIEGIPFKARVGFDKGDADRLKLGQCRPLNAPAGAPAANGGPAPGAGKQRAWD